MKKLFLKKSILYITAIGLIILFLFVINNVKAASTVATVSNRQEFENAINNNSINVIEIKSDINFSKSIFDRGYNCIIPENREITIRSIDNTQKTFSWIEFTISNHSILRLESNLSINDRLTQGSTYTSYNPIIVENGGTLSMNGNIEIGTDNGYGGKNVGIGVSVYTGGKAEISTTKRIFGASGSIKAEEGSELKIINGIFDSENENDSDGYPCVDIYGKAEINGGTFKNIKIEPSATVQITGGTIDASITESTDKLLRCPLDVWGTLYIEDYLTVIDSRTITGNRDGSSLNFSAINESVHFENDSKTYIRSGNRQNNDVILNQSSTYSYTDNRVTPMISIPSFSDTSNKISSVGYLYYEGTSGGIYSTNNFGLYTLNENVKQPDTFINLVDLDLGETNITKMNVTNSSQNGEISIDNFKNQKPMIYRMYGKYTINSGIINNSVKVESGSLVEVFSPLATFNHILNSIDIQKNNQSCDKIVIKKGETINLTTSLNPKATLYKNVDWSSSDNTVASVDATGQVTANDIGISTITATSSVYSKTDTINVYVVDPVINGQETVDFLSSEVSYTLQGLPSPDSNDNSGLTVKWSSSDSTIAITIDDNGKLIPKKIGDVTLTAKLNLDGIETGISTTKLVTISISDHLNSLNVYLKGNHGMNKNCQDMSIPIMSNSYSITDSGIDSDSKKYVTLNILPNEYINEYNTSINGTYQKHRLYPTEQSLKPKITFDNDNKPLSSIDLIFTITCLEDNTVCIDINWGDLVYSYKAKNYNPQTHQYNDGEWVTPDRTITMTNYGLVDVTANLSYETSTDPIFSNVTGKLDTNSVDLLIGESKQVTFSLDGKPQFFKGTQTIGNINISINNKVGE